MSRPAARARSHRVTSRDRPSVTESIVFLYAPFLLALTLAFASVTDDPFITLRYAANLVHGYGLAFNPGQHVQGFTSPLHLLLATGMYLVPGGHDLLKLKLLSVLFAALALREASRLVYGIDLPLWAKRLACVACGANWVIGFAAGNALETTLEVWLLMALARRLVLTGPERSTSMLALLAFGAVLTRLDAMIPLTLMAGVGLLVHRPSALWRRIRWFSGALAGLVLVTLGELLFFGTVLPNTFYAKQVSAGRGLSLGWTYLYDPLITEGLGTPTTHNLYVAAFIIQCTLGAVGVVAILTKYPRCGYLVAIVLGQTLFILHTGGDWMYGGRFMAVIELPLVIVDVLGIVTVVGAIRKRMSWWALWTVASVGGAAILAASVLPFIPTHAPAWKIQGLSDRALLDSGGYEGFSQFWSGFPAELDCLKPGQLIATTEVGFIGFSHQDVRILDIRGLTDPSIARHAPTPVRFPWGVDDPQWFDASSVVGQVILKQSPVLIADFDTHPPKNDVLGGHYRLFRLAKFGSLTVALYSHAASRSACPS